MSWEAGPIWVPPSSRPAPTDPGIPSSHMLPGTWVAPWDSSEVCPCWVAKLVSMAQRRDEGLEFKSQPHCLLRPVILNLLEAARGLDVISVSKYTQLVLRNGNSLSFLPKLCFLNLNLRKKKGVWGGIPLWFSG